jgi:uncharacterized protein
VAGEENITHAAALPTSVPIIAGSAQSYADLAPYSTSTQWRPWPAFGMVVLISFVSIGIAIGGSLVLLRLSGLSASANLKSGTPLLFMLTAQMLMIAGALLAAGVKGDSVATALALKQPAGGVATYAKSLAAMLAVVGLYMGVTHFIVGHDPKNDLAELVDLFRGRWWPIALLVIGVGAPLSEELLFRGFLQSALVPSRLGYWGASIVTTTFWTSLHAGYSAVGLIEVFLIGIVFAIILRRTGSLWVTIVCHGIYNTGIALLLIFAPKEWLGF